MQLKYFNDLSLYLGEKKKKSPPQSIMKVLYKKIRCLRKWGYFSLERMGNYIAAAVTIKRGYLFHSFGEITTHFISLSHQWDNGWSVVEVVVNVDILVKKLCQSVPNFEEIHQLMLDDSYSPISTVMLPSSKTCHLLHPTDPPLSLPGCQKRFKLMQKHFLKPVNLLTWWIMICLLSVAYLQIHKLLSP